ncbi:hypothetical protein A2686_02300 [Candidatus Woesebacteria bacterium RIFCSPHIGHO2_01_FULL_38_10]|uniref:ABC transporter permease n=1 Tax=Candidatus Woesebacteria bacterium RIFCSPLOWO2_01_FULL_39_10b TaxID=1802517 RepID=A0A1F8BAV0_9BACT|nr:MAG: hypothetical protein A2686_02300 [Candidatus Woesebacteria bacterium RIFCSPHIGHO2_01_FULL_38_10]OGM60809.1 MAG: hypothetical protein A2892_02075 [Candidatus Woesebacteria bacterium RIFCSPLOWO2_01_FULL_39_10b]
MKLLELKQKVINKILLIKAITIYTFQQETAYWANTWAHVLSTFFYMLSMILFIDVVYSNVNLVAGYTKNEMLLFLLMAQATYYLSWTIYGNLIDLVENVNNGNLDLVLVKPISSLFYITFRRIRLFRVAMDGIPPLIFLALAINWSALNISFLPLLIGIIISVMGTVCSLSFHLLATLPVFWVGESRNIVEFTSHFEYNVGKIIPLEGYGKDFKFFFSTIFPFLISTGFSTSVILGKSEPLPTLLWGLTVTILMLTVRQFAWNKALKVYTSASS